MGVCSSAAASDNEVVAKATVAPAGPRTDAATAAAPLTTARQLPERYETAAPPAPAPAPSAQKAQPDRTEQVAASPPALKGAERQSASRASGGAYGLYLSVPPSTTRGSSLPAGAHACRLPVMQLHRAVARRCL